MCSPEVLKIELNVTKEMLIKKGYSNPLIDRVFKTEINRLNYIKPYCPENCLVLWILPYAGKNRLRLKETSRS